MIIIIIMIIPVLLGAEDPFVEGDIVGKSSWWKPEIQSDIRETSSIQLCFEIHPTL